MRTLTLRQLRRREEEGRLEVMDDLDENSQENVVETRDMETGERQVVRVVDRKLNDLSWAEVDNFLNRR